MTDRLQVVAFKWRTPGYRSQFRGAHVNVLRRMVARNYRKPHDFVCVTDDPRGIETGIRIVPLWPDHGRLQNPMGRHQPSCYRRLKLFSAEAEQIIGKRFIALDLDIVVTGDLAPIFDRTEDFVMWGDTHPRTFYNGSMMLMTAGARREVWDEFDPATSPAKAKAAGHFGSDQGWISYRLGRGQAMWGQAEGIYSWRVHLVQGQKPLPENARVVIFHGKQDPWGPVAQRHAWVRENWR